MNSAEQMAIKAVQNPSQTAETGLTAGLIERMAAAAVLTAVGTALALGWFYRQQLSAALDPEQDFGYVLGIVGGSLMLILLGYPLRKRLKCLCPLPRRRSFFLPAAPPPSCRTGWFYR